MKIVLGSKSPRRKELLSQLGYEFLVFAPNIIEDDNGATPEEVVKGIAMKKAMASREKFPNDLVICADTIVVIDDEILGKPINEHQAYTMIEKIQGREHSVLTSVVCWYQDTKMTFTEVTRVDVLPMTNLQIKNYIQTKEPYDKAGGYGIQGEFGKFISSINGDYYNVMGLPISKVYQAIEQIKNLTKC